ncbi:DUF998 domain-containing protein [Nonomuraea maritima]|uniref:DUF998 domain-containing protein n=1 Tax=Nonomuraea maritima TaxID=683260 RepID=UPI0037248778
MRRLWAGGAVAATVVSAGAVAYAQAELPAQPLLSDYALVPGGMAPVLVGMLALAGACLCLAYGLARQDPGRTAATRVLLLAGAGGLIMSAIFPTDPGTSQIGTLAGEIHRWSSAVVFTSLPMAGWMLARRAGTPWWRAAPSAAEAPSAAKAPSAAMTAVRAMSVAAAVTLGAYLVAHPASFTSPLVGGDAYYGLLERGLVLAEMALLVVMAVAAATSAAPAAQAAPERNAPSEEPATERQRLAA